MVGVIGLVVVLDVLTDALLLLSYGAIFVSDQNGFEVENFLAQGGDLSRKRIVLAAKNLDLLLQVGEPLFLALSAFQRCDPVYVIRSNLQIAEINSVAYLFRSKKFLRFSSSVIFFPFS